MSANPSDPFEFLKKLWAPMGLPMSGMGMPGMVFPTVDVAEIERRMNELRSVETWLSLNIEIVRTTIKALEAQRATVQAFASMQQSAQASMAGDAASADAASEAKSSGEATPAPTPPGVKRPKKAP
jgi:hypothetical protein